MKTYKKVVISSLTSLSVLTLAGSISGTIAWYQYATKAQVAYTGTSAHCSKLLQLSVADSEGNPTTWSTDILSSQLPDIDFAAVTSGEQEKDAPLLQKTRTTNTYDDNGEVVGTQTISSYLYAQPVRGQGLYDKWLLAAPTSYLRFDLLVKVVDIDGKDVENDLANDVYLTDLTIQDANNSALDLSDAVRVHISSSYLDNGSQESKNFLFAKESEDIEVGGFLNLIGNEPDQAGYEWERHTCVYGGGTLKTDDNGNIIEPEEVIDVPHQTSYKADDPTIIAKDANGSFEGCTSIGKTSAVNNQYLKLTITIWLEGWSLLSHGVSGTQDASVWDAASYIGKDFNVGMTFEVATNNL